MEWICQPIAYKLLKFLGFSWVFGVNTFILTLCFSNNFGVSRTDRKIGEIVNIPNDKTLI